jgi:Fe-S-cluster-containing hydrogenase component 2/DMSO reductase anchor subunit
MLENSWDVRARNIYSSDIEAFKPEALVNLSLACNHCHEPLCLSGCPSQAYRKEKSTGAVIVEPDHCIGCRYCIWNCPYDAPRLNTGTGLIDKCHLCYHRLEAGMEPACSSACPTGALSFGTIPEVILSGTPSWFPDKGMNPALLLTGGIDKGNYDPRPKREHKPVPSHVSPKSINDEWSLIIFTFLVTLSAGISISSILVDDFTLKFISFASAAVSGIASLFHLGNPLRAWRAVRNMRSSPVSREIALYILFILLAFFSLVSDSLILPYLNAAAGIALMIAIDNIYSYSLRNNTLYLNSGQSFLTGLLIGSFFLEAEIPFLFIASIKLIMNFIMFFKVRKSNTVFNLRFFRTAILGLLSVYMISGNDAWTGAGTALFLSGELLDRIIFYYDFQPLTIIDKLRKISDDKKTD